MTKILLALTLVATLTLGFTCTASSVKRESLTKAHQIEVTLDAGFDTVTNLAHTHLISPAVEKKSIDAIKKANKAVLVFNAKAAKIDPNTITGDEKANLLAAWEDVISALKDPDILAAGGIKSPATQQTINALVQTAIETANAVEQILTAIEVKR